MLGHRILFLVWRFTERYQSSNLSCGDLSWNYFVSVIVCMFGLAVRLSRPYLRARGKTTTCNSRSYATPAGALVVSHAHEESTLVKHFPKEKIREAKALIQQDSVKWTPGRLAEHFGVPKSVIRATVPLPTKKLWKVCWIQLSKIIDLGKR